MCHLVGKFEYRYIGFILESAVPALSWIPGKIVRFAKYKLGLRKLHNDLRTKTSFTNCRLKIMTNVIFTALASRAWIVTLFLPNLIFFFDVVWFSFLGTRLSTLICRRNKLML